MKGPILIDTMVLVKALNKRDKEHEQAQTCLVHLLSSSEDLVVCLQNLVEFWAVATRPIKRKGLGWSTERTFLEIQKIRASFVVLEDPDDWFSTWINMVKAHRLEGKDVHDARIASIMLRNNVHKVVSSDRKGFDPIAEIQRIEMSQVSSL